MSASAANYVQRVDAKWRLPVPLKFRSTFAPEFQMFLDHDNYLGLVSLQRWQELVEYMDSQRKLNPDDDDLQDAVDRTYNFSEEVSVDGSGRFVIPSRLRPECDLQPETEAVFVGRADRVTLVSLASFEQAFEPKLRSEDARAAQKRLLRGV